MCLPLKPFKIEQEWKSSGLSCVVVIAREASHRCGYVRVPPTHSQFNKDYNTLDVNVHGGLTFGEIEPCIEHEDGQGYWFGFDCAHSGDASYDPNVKIEDIQDPTTKRLYQFHFDAFIKPCSTMYEHYWTKEEVIAECEKLAAQLAVM